MFTSEQAKRYGNALIAMLLSTSAFAEHCVEPTGCKLPVNFKGVFLEETCVVSINNGGSNALVSLPRINTNLLKKDGAESGTSQFKIALKKCPSGKSVNLFFIPAGIPVDDVTGNLTNSSGNGMSKSVQVRIRNVDGVHLRPGNKNDFQAYGIPATGEEVTHFFLASYYANGDNMVTPGLLNTVVGVELIYN